MQGGEARLEGGERGRAGRVVIGDVRAAKVGVATQDGDDAPPTLVFLVVDIHDAHGLRGVGAHPGCLRHRYLTRHNRARHKARWHVNVAHHAMHRRPAVVEAAA